MTFPVLFFGVRTCACAGHYLHAPGVYVPMHELEQSLPEALRRLDGVWCYPTPRTLEQVRNRLYEYGKREDEGRAYIHDVAGWTIVSWWDRSEDPRGGCNAAFLAPGRKAFAQMLALAREHFPREMRRMESAYAVALAGGDLAPNGDGDAAEAFLAAFHALHPAVQTIVARRIRSEVP